MALSIQQLADYLLHKTRVLVNNVLSGEWITKATLHKLAKQSPLTAIPSVPLQPIGHSRPSSIYMLECPGSRDCEAYKSI
jgi:hypothetical protein